MRSSEAWLLVRRERQPGPLRWRRPFANQRIKEGLQGWVSTSPAVSKRGAGQVDSVVPSAMPHFAERGFAARYTRHACGGRWKRTSPSCRQFRISGTPPTLHRKLGYPKQVRSPLSRITPDKRFDLIGAVLARETASLEAP